MHSGARHLAHRPQPGERGPAVEAGGHPAHVVVGRRRHRDGLGPRVDAVLQAQVEHRGEAVGEGGADGGGGVEVDAVPRLQAGPDRPSHHVARGQLGIGVLPDHEAASGVVHQDRPLAAQGLGEQGHGVPPAGQSGGVELHELQVGQPRSCPGGHRQAVAGHLGRVGGVGVQTADAPGGQHHRRGQGQHLLPFRGAHRHPDHPAAVPDEVGREGVGQSLDVLGGRRRPDQGAHHLGAGGVAAGVQHPASVVAPLPAQQQAAVGPGVEVHPQGLQRRHPFRGGGSQHLHCPRVVEAPAHRHRVGGMFPRGVVGGHRGGDAALGPRGGPAAGVALGDHQHPARGHGQGGGQAADAGAHHDGLGPEEAVEGVAHRRRPSPRGPGPPPACAPPPGGPGRPPPGPPAPRSADG